MAPFPSEIILALEVTYEVVKYQQCISLKQTAVSRDFAPDEMGKWNKSEDTVIIFIPGRLLLLLCKGETNGIRLGLKAML
jgi:hypothetical protein